jgi:hypothetical protein
MTEKNTVEAILKLLEVLLSWPVITLVFVLLIRRQLPGLSQQLAERMTKAPGGFEFATLQSKVDGIEKKVQRIEEHIFFRPSPYLSEELRDRLTALIERFHTYLTLEHIQRYETAIKRDLRRNIELPERLQLGAGQPPAPTVTASTGWR